MKLAQLRDMVAIVEHGSLRAAARHLDVAQPLLTRSIRALEKELGSSLFERQARGMTLTLSGRLFHHRASAIINEIRRAKDELSQVEGRGHGTLTAGLSIMPHVGMLPHALPAFRRRFPNVQLQLLEMLFPALEGRLRDGSVDFYLGVSPNEPPASGLGMETLFKNSRVVVGRVNHPLADASSLSDLVGAEWAVPWIDHKAGDDLARIFALFGLPSPRLVLQAGSALSLMVALANTDLLALLPLQWGDLPIAKTALKVISVKEKIPAPDIVLIRNTDLPLTPAAEHLVDLMMRSAPSVG